MQVIVLTQKRGSSSGSKLTNRLFACCSIKGNSFSSSEDGFLFESNDGFAGTFLFFMISEDASADVERFDAVLGFLALPLLVFLNFRLIVLLIRTFSARCRWFSSGGGGGVFLFCSS